MVSTKANVVTTDAGDTVASVQKAVANIAVFICTVGPLAPYVTKFSGGRVRSISTSQIIK